MAETKTKTKEDVAREDRAVAERSGAVVGAQAVADAVKKVADAAVEGAKKVGGPVPDIFVSGVAAGRFVIRGAGFGTGGVVKVNGHPAQTTGWGSTRIEGTFPPGTKSGEVEIHVDDKTVLRAPFK